MKEFLRRIVRNPAVIITVFSALLLGIGGYLLWLDTNPGASADDGSGDTLVIKNVDSEITWEHHTIDVTTISEVAAGEERNILIGADWTDVGGFDPDTEELTTLQTAGRTNYLQALIAQNDEIWAGYLHTGLVHFDGEEWSTINQASGLLSNSVNAIAIADDGQLWIGHGAQDRSMVGGGLSYQVDGEWQTMAEFGEMGSNNVSDIVIHPSGNVFVGVTDYTNYLGDQTGGLLVYNGSKWQKIGTEQGLVSSDVRALTVAENGDVWVATSNGLSVSRSGLWASYTTENGLVSDFVVDVAVDGNGRVWAATGAGVSIYDGAAWGTLTESDGLLSNFVSALAPDDTNGMLIATNEGVSRITVNLDLPEPTNVVFKNYIPIVIKADLEN